MINLNLNIAFRRAKAASPSYMEAAGNPPFPILRLCCMITKSTGHMKEWNMRRGGVSVYLLLRGGPNRFSDQSSCESACLSSRSNSNSVNPPSSLFFSSSSSSSPCFDHPFEFGKCGGGLRRWSYVWQVIFCLTRWKHFFDLDCLDNWISRPPPAKYSSTPAAAVETTGQKTRKNYQSVF